MIKNESSYNRFAFYHQNEALLYQFFLHECIETCLLLVEPLSLLLLKQLIREVDCQSRCSHGHLPRMLHYCELHKANFEQTQIMTLIGKTLERAHLAGVVCSDFVAQNTKEHKKSYQQLKREIKKVGSFLFDLLPNYRDNPHVLYFVLRRSKQLDTLYGKQRVAAFFHSLFPNGLLEAERFLLDKFSEKGFHHLLPRIQKLLQEV